jgi:hypothetical protein
MDNKYDHIQHFMLRSNNVYLLIEYSLDDEKVQKLKQIFDSKHLLLDYTINRQFNRFCFYFLFSIKLFVF